MSEREKSLKVAYFLNIFPLLSETFILNEIIELKRQGLDVAIFSLKKPDKNITHKEAEDLVGETCYLSNFSDQSKLKKAYTYFYSHLYFFIRNPFRYSKALWFAYNIYGKLLGPFKIAGFYAFKLKSLRVKHVHAHFANTPSEFAMLISLISGLPYSFTPHAYDIFIRPNLIKEKINFADFVISKTEYNKRFLEEKHPGIDGKKIRVIHYGIDMRKFIPSKYYKERKLPFAILSVARLVEKKGHKYLLHACHILTKSGITDFVCKIIGDGPLKSDLEELALELGLSENVQFMGAFPSDRVVEVLKESDLFILPCVVAEDGDIDGMPNSLIEAMALGKPVISTNVSGVPELIKDGSGILVPQRDSESLARAIEEIYSMTPEMRMKMGQKGCEIVKREFDIRKVVKEINELYSSYLAPTDYSRL